jgi:hypothetical protein
MDKKKNFESDYLKTAGFEFLILADRSMIIILIIL